MRNRLSLLLALAAAALAACGGGGGGSGGGPLATTAATTASGTMTRTAASTITVNGDSFDVATAGVRIDDRPGTVGELQSGMRVRVRGTDDGAGTRRAGEVEVENEVRGAITSVSAASAPQFFNIGSIKVVVDGATVYANLAPASFAALQAGVFVEVHGARDSAGVLVATRVEGKGARNAASPEVDELHGFVGTVGVGQFTIGAITVSFTATTTFTPASRCSAAALVPGLRIEVHGAFTGTGAFAATRIDCEDIEDESRRGGNGERASIEGLIANLDTSARTFTISGQRVRYTASTRFERGTEADLALNVKVHAKGTFDGTTLVAAEIEFERLRIIFTGIPTVVGAASVTIFGRTVQVNDRTEVRAETAAGGDSSSLADVTAGADRIEVRALLENGTLLAERITEVGNSGGGGRDIVQAPVVAKNEAARTLGLLDAGNPINVALTGAQLEGADGTVLGAAAFFGQITVGSGSTPGTLVKAQGRFNGGTLTAEEAEIEH